MKVIVIGCGVIGLSSGIRLLEAGYGVTIWAKELPPHTTSNVAAAVWYPYKIAPVAKAAQWSAQSYQVFGELAQSADAGVSFRNGVLLYQVVGENPEWRFGVRNFRFAQPHELPPPYIYGYFFDAPVIETPLYMQYLQNRFVAQGGSIFQREVKSLDEVLAESSIVVNCTGLGSYDLLNDHQLYPIRGQIVRVERIASSSYVSAEDKNGTASYVIPRSHDCILGGTAQIDNWSLEPDSITANVIRQKCGELLPDTKEVKVLEHLVGLRPGRPEVRLEMETLHDGKKLVHNYGHGGAGVTVSWGCAAEVVQLLQNN